MAIDKAVVVNFSGTERRRTLRLELLGERDDTPQVIAHREVVVYDDHSEVWSSKPVGSVYRVVDSAVDGEKVTITDAASQQVTLTLSDVRKALEAFVDKWDGEDNGPF